VIDPRAIQQRAARRHAALERAWADPRYKRVLGRYLASGLFTTNMDVEPYRGAITVEDALWAGRVEPRVLELLPALIVKRPSLFVNATRLPPDLRAVVHALRRNERPPDFRGIPGAALLRWLPSVGHKGKLPSRLKAFRLQADDLALLDRLSVELDLSQTDVLRRALRSLAAAQLRDAKETATR